MLASFRRWALEAEDWLRYHPTVRRLVSAREERRGRPAADDPASLARAISRLSAAARLRERTPGERGLQERIRALVARLGSRRVDWKAHFDRFEDPRLLPAALLKPCRGPREKGVVFIAFEYAWVRLLGLARLQDFADRYWVVVAPSQSPHNLVNYVFPAQFPAPVFTLVSNPHDLEVLPGVSPRLIAVPLLASHWVNPGLIRPSPRDNRPFDVVMVANFAKVKRHFALFRALRQAPRKLRVLLVGQEQDGRTAETVRAVARLYGVEDRVTVHADQPYDRIGPWLGQGRVSVILSKREGACVVVAESLFADTPAALLRGAAVGSRGFLNGQTGRLLEECSLARDLLAFLDDAGRYHPRAWAEQHISCFSSTAILNDHLRRHSLELGFDWTEDIRPLEWSPDPRLAESEDREALRAELAGIREQFGLILGRDPPPEVGSQG